MSVVPLPILLTEPDAAQRLGISLSMLQRLRRGGRIEFFRIGRLVKYKEAQLTDYLEAAACREKSGPTKSADAGSRAGAIHPCGAAPGSIPFLDKQSARALALAILKKPGARSRSGG